MDLFGQGDTPEEAMESLDQSVRIAIEDAQEHGALQSLFRPAPPEVWRKWAERMLKDAVKRKKGLHGKAPRGREKARGVRFDLVMDSHCVPA